MKAVKRIAKRRLRRTLRVRKELHGTSERPRLSVHRTHKHIAVQLVDDDLGRTLAAATSTARTLTDDLQGKSKTERARVIGSEIARKAQKAGVNRAIFDRGSRKYHGRVKALADAAREGGLKF